MHLNSPEASAGQISVVTPAFRGIATICDCIKSIVEAGAGFSIEILVVESSNDGTVDLVRKEFPFVRILAMPSQVSAGQARNIRCTGSQRAVCTLRRSRLRRTERLDSAVTARIR